MSTIPQKLDLVENHLNTILFERRPVIRTAVTGLLAECHHVQYGVPGTAKSMVPDELHKVISGHTYFRWLMTQTTSPEEVFGPFSIKGMENDEFVRQLDGKMVRADIAFMDEIFNANSPILNSFYTIMNEGLYFNGKDTLEVHPLIYSGTNSLPRGNELAALWDRIDFRHVVVPMKETGNVERMMRAHLARRIASVTKTKTDPIISWEEILEAQKASKLVDFSDEVWESLIKLRAVLKKKGIEFSERRLNKCIAVIQATAYRAGRSIADVDDMRDLRHMLWSDPNQIGIVEEEVFALANPLDKEAMDLVKIVNALAAEAEQILKETDNEQTRQNRAIEVNGKLDRVAKDLNVLIKKVRASKRRTDMVIEAQDRLKEVVSNILWEFFGLRDDDK